MSKKDEKDINISKLDKSLEGQGLLEDADDAEYERTLAQQRREAEERERQVLADEVSQALSLLLTQQSAQFTIRRNGVPRLINVSVGELTGMNGLRHERTQ